MRLTHLERLEAEAIDIMRDVVAVAENPVMLYSIGKDSSVMLRLAEKAFWPAPPPFPFLHVDKTWKFTHWQLSSYLDVQNVYNQGNVEGISYNYNYTASVYAQGLPFLPSLGLRAEF